MIIIKFRNRKGWSTCEEIVWHSCSFYCLDSRSISVFCWYSRRRPRRFDGLSWRSLQGRRQHGSSLWPRGHKMGLVGGGQNERREDTVMLLGFHYIMESSVEVGVRLVDQLRRITWQHAANLGASGSLDHLRCTYCLQIHSLLDFDYVENPIFVKCKSCNLYRKCCHSNFGCPSDLDSVEAHKHFLHLRLHSFHHPLCHQKHEFGHQQHRGRDPWPCRSNFLTPNTEK